MAFTFVQSSYVAISTGYIGFTPTAGNVLIIGVAKPSGVTSDATLVVSDDSGTTYSMGSQYDGGMAIVYGVVPSTPPTILTATWDGSSYSGQIFTVYEFATSGGIALAQETSGDSGGTSTQFVPPLLKAKQAGDLVVGFVTTNEPISSYTGWTLPDPAYSLYYLDSTGASYTPEFLFGDSNGTYSFAACEFFTPSATLGTLSVSGSISSPSAHASATIALTTLTAAWSKHNPSGSGAASQTMPALSIATLAKAFAGKGYASNFVNALGISSSVNSPTPSVPATALAATLAATLLSQSVTTSGTANINLASLLLNAFAEEFKNSGAAQAALSTLLSSSEMGTLGPSIVAPVVLATLTASLTSSALNGTGTASQILPAETLDAVAQAFIASGEATRTLSGLEALASLGSVPASVEGIAALATQVIAGALTSLSGSGQADTTLSALTIFGLVALFHRIVRMAKASEQAEFGFDSITDLSVAKLSSIEASAIRLGTITESQE